MDSNKYQLNKYHRVADMGTTRSIITSFLHCLDQSCLLGDTLDVNLDVGQRKTLEVDLAPDHIGSIHECLIQIMHKSNEKFNFSMQQSITQEN
jgi:hypothetical protein